MKESTHQFYYKHGYSVVDKIEIEIEHYDDNYLFENLFFSIINKNDVRYYYGFKNYVFTIYDIFFYWMDN